MYFFLENVELSNSLSLSTELQLGDGGVAISARLCIARIWPPELSITLDIFNLFQPAFVGLLQLFLAFFWRVCPFWTVNYSSFQRPSIGKSLSRDCMLWLVTLNLFVPGLCVIVGFESDVAKQTMHAADLAVIRLRVLVLECVDSCQFVILRSP